MDVKRKRLLLCLCVIVVNSTAVYAQPDVLWANQQVSIKARGIRLDALLELITQKTGVPFSYSPQKIPVQQKITLAINNQPLGKIIETLSRYAGFSYRQKGKHLVLKKREPVNNTVQKIKARPLSTAIAPSVKSENSVKPDIPTSIKNSRPDTPVMKIIQQPVQSNALPVAKKADSLLKASKADSILVVVLEEDNDQYLLLSDWSIGQLVAELRNQQPVYSFDILDDVRYYPAKNIAIKTEKLLRDSLEHTKRNKYRYEKSIDFVTSKSSKADIPFYLTAGIIADEIFYVNPSIRIGIKPFHALLAYNGRGNGVSRAEWGLGTNWSINDQWNFSVTATLGSALKKNYHQLFDVQNQIYRLNTFVEKKLGKNWFISGGLHFQLMESKYFISGQPVQINAGTDLYISNLKIITPPYEISNSISSAGTTRRQTWAGGRLGFFYQFDFSPKSTRVYPAKSL
jgi:hypothetical protein